MTAWYGLSIVDPTRDEGDRHVGTGLFDEEHVDAVKAEHAGHEILVVGPIPEDVLSDHQTRNVLMTAAEMAATGHDDMQPVRVDQDDLR